jgi:hypothetical protein
MIACMRRWLLMVMVLLLPLRAWVGEAMAGRCSSQQQQSMVPLFRRCADDPARAGHCPRIGA